MNRNTILAFVLILASITFFTSPIYYEILYEKILHKPNPYKEKKKEIKKETVVAPQEKAAPVEAKKNTEKIALQKDTIHDTIAEAKTDTVQQKIDTIWIETEKLVCGISEKGGRFISIQVKDYTYTSHKKKGKKAHDYIELVQDPDMGGSNLRVNDKDYDKEIFKCRGDSTRMVLKKDTASIGFVFISKELGAIEKVYTFYKKEYKIGYKLSANNLKEKKVEIGWKCGITESEKATGGYLLSDPRKVHLYDGNNVEHVLEKKKTKIEETGLYNWIGITSKYFLVACVPDTVFDADIDIEAYELNPEEKSKEINYRFSMKRFAQSDEESFWFYAGPSELEPMKRYNIGLQRVLFQGYKAFFWADKWFPPICEFVLWLLIELQRFVTDYGVVIIILTIMLRIVTYPLTVSSMKSMSKMKELQPKINEIREKNKGNPQKMNQKLMEYYKKEGVNPLAGAGGCLPMLLQMPIMIALFIVLRKAIELRGQDTYLIPWITDLSKAEVFIPLGFTLPIYGSNIALLPILMAVLMYFQNKMTIKDPNQKMMIYFMPVFMLVMFNNFPSGLSLYFVFSSALQLLQQIYMDKKAAKKLKKA